MFWEKQSSITLTPELNIKNIDLDYLSKIQVLKFCSKDFLKKLAKQFIVENHEAKKTIFIEGSMGDKFYLIARGEVEVLKKTSHHTMQLIAQLSDGDYFGEISLLTNERHNATVITLTPCLLLTLSRQQFEKLLLRFPELQTEIESIAIKRRSNLN